MNTDYEMTLNLTGERMIPEQSDAVTFWEHLYRYRFAARFVRYQRVLDIACGEGYGAACLRQAGAASVIGIDVAADACQHARCKYGINVLAGDAECLPLSAKSIDVIVSFETVEHLHNPEKFLAECARILTPRGKLVISTPNKNVYHHTGRSSRFHKSEMTSGEFHVLLTQYFRRCKFYTQMPTMATWWTNQPFALTTSPWLQIRGGWRLRTVMHQAACAHISTGELGSTVRKQSVERILDYEPWFASLVNPYRVQRQLPRDRATPIYLIAVAEA